MSKNLLAISALCGALLVTSAAHAQSAYHNFPLEKGNTWVYITDSEGYLVGDTGTRMIHVDREWYLGGNWYANRLNGLFSPDSSVIMYDRTGYPNMWVHDGSAWSIALRFAAAIGDLWSFRATACDAFDVQRYDTAGSTITVPAGDFTDTLGFTFTHTPDPAARCAGPALRSLITVPGLGPIAFSTDQHKGHLLYARIDDTVVAAAPHNARTLDGIETTLLVAEDQLVHESIVCITTPCIGPAAQLNVAFIVRNTSTTTKTFSFTDGQAFEIDLWVGDENVRSYSDGRLFTEALWSFTLAPGESRVFSGHLPLSRFDDSTPLVGDVQVVGFMKNTEGAGKLDITVNGSY